MDIEFKPIEFDALVEKAINRWLVKEPVKVKTNDRKENRPPPRNSNDRPKPERPKRP